MEASKISAKTKRRRPGRGAAARLIIVFAALCIAASGCARYAPIPPPAPKDKLLKVLLYTKQSITNDFYYYIAVDLSGDDASYGPQPYFSGIHTAENWDYYIRYHGGVFTENIIETEDDLFEEPPYLNYTSPRYYSTSQSGTQIIVRIYLAQLKSDSEFTMKFNFITSRLPLQDDYSIPDSEVVVDYLKNITETTFSISNDAGEMVYASDYPNLGKTITVEDDYPADIVNWVVEIEEI